VTTATRKIPRHQLETYFDKFSKHFLIHESTNAVDVELVAPQWGDQFEDKGVHLRGITYDPKDDAMEFELEGGDHRILHPKEVWAVEEEDGFVKSIEVVAPDDTREIVQINRLGVRTTT